MKGKEDIENVVANAEYKVEKMEVFPLNLKKIMVLALSSLGLILKQPADCLSQGNCINLKLEARTA